jgi:nucleotide-binding universal stress UspA family protein
MVNLRKIAITTDLSGFSLAALEFAASLRLLYTAKLYMLYVSEESPVILPTLHGLETDVEGLRLRMAQDAKVELDRFMKLHVNPDLNIIPVVRMGHPSDEIIAFSREEHIDLIVMATHGRTGFEHVLLGSIAEKVVRNSPVPVLTIKPPSVREPILKSEDVENELHLR